MTKKIIIVLLAVILTLGLVACKNKDSHTLTFVGKDGAEVVATMEVSDERIDIPEAPVIDGYQFAGWYLHSANSGVKLDSEYFIRNVAKSDVTAYALYKKINHNLTFYFDEPEYGTAYKVALRQVSNEAIELPEPPPYAHHNFIGWFIKDGDNEIELTPDYFVNNPATGAVSAYAKYERVEYTLTFKAGDVVIGQIKISDDKIKLLEAPVVPNYNFTGWFLENSTKKIDEEYFTKFYATKDMTVYASYTDAFTVVPTSKDTCTIVGFEGDFTEVEIPGKMTLKIGNLAESEYVVDTIAADAFANNDTIESIFVPATVTTIEPGAFKNCSALKYITVDAANTVYTSGDASNCIIKVETSTVPGEEEGAEPTVVVKKTLIVGSANSVIPEDVTEIADYAFAGNAALKSLVIPASVKTIATTAFLNTAIEDVTAPTWAYAYLNVSELVNVVVNAGDDIGANAFKGAVKLKSVSLGSVKTIGANAFEGCIVLKSLHIPSSVTKIEASAFGGCIGLESITADENENYRAVGNCLIEVEKIKTADGVTESNMLIKGCDNSVVPADQYITSIYVGAFAGCEKLTEIYIPAGVKTLAADSFKGCKALVKVVIADPECKLDGDVFNGCTKFENIEVPAALLEYFIEKASKTLVTVNVNAGATIPANCFAGCSELTTVTFSASVEEIGASAFAGCKKLTALVLTADSNLKTIGHNAFDGCIAFSTIVVDAAFDSAASFVIPASVASIGDYAFRGTAINSLAFAENCELTTIGYKVFAECKSLTDVSIPDTLVSVDFDAFNGCTKIKNVTIPADFVRSLANVNVSAIETLEITVGELDKVIDLYCIREMTGLKKLVIGKDVTKIDNRAFEGCSKLEEIVVAEGNTTFYSEGNCLIKIDTETEPKTLVLGCMKSVIPADVKIIASYAFAQSNIAEIVIPATVKTVKTYAFSSCRKLATITIESAATVLEDKAFDGCNAVTKAVIPANAIKYIPQVALKEIEITAGTVEGNAFENCLTLTAIKLASGVTANTDAFKGCVNVTKISAHITNITCILENVDAEKLVELEIIAGTVGVETLADCVNVTTLTLVNGVTVDEGAFDHLTIKVATLPASYISKIPTADLVSLTVTSGPVSTDGETDLSALKSLTFGDDVTEISADTFAGLTKLNSVDFNNVATIGAGAFAGCNALTAIDLTNVTVIGDGAFADCAKLVKVTVSASNIASVPKNITTLVVASGDLTDGAITGFENLNSLVIGKDVTSISAASISDEIKYSLKSVSVDSANALYVYHAESKCIMTKVEEGVESQVVIDFNAPEADPAA